MSTQGNTEQNYGFGFITSGSSASVIQVGMFAHAGSTPVIGRAIFIDQEMDNGTYRALGTVTDVSTFNKSLSDPTMAQAMSTQRAGNMTGSDVRSLTLKIQSTYFRAKDSVEWQKASSALPNSPGTGVKVHLLEEENIQELIATDQDVVHLGNMRGMTGVPAPLNVPNFSSQRGAAHTGILGRSGSGKTAFASFVLSSQMSHENHAIIVVDPQGQWSHENGFIFSVQAFARALGREVSVLRVAEDIRLPLHEELLGKLFDHIDLWGKGFQRMAAENKAAFSDEVARAIAYHKDGVAVTDREPRQLLTSIFEKIANSGSTLRRIYASKDRIDGLQRQLLILSGVTPLNSEGEMEVIEADEWDDAEITWGRILDRFVPLINLFSNTNLSGGKRRPLGGQRGFLTEVMQVRGDNPTTPAPYVILDMSSDVSGKAKEAYAKGLRMDDEDTRATGMKQVLDKEDIKALIVSALLEQIKSSAEVAFSEGSGNLNTQIVFDEAWRYARNVTTAEAETPIGELSKTLEGFALDTRKYGIGWTYILQVPSDLNRGIWRQLSYVYSGYGIIGSDKKMLAELMDEQDRQAQMGLYDQFAPPSSTNKYPFMLNGPISPLIFTNTPVFVDAYNSIDQFIADNAHWIEDITQRRGLTSLVANPRSVAVGARKPKKKVEESDADEKPVKSYKIGGTAMGAGPSRRTSATPPKKVVEHSKSAATQFGAVPPPPF